LSKEKKNEKQTKKGKKKDDVNGVYFKIIPIRLDGFDAVLLCDAVDGVGLDTVNPAWRKRTQGGRGEKLSSFGKC
jgi:hypothetical protein